MLKKLSFQLLLLALCAMLFATPAHAAKTEFSDGTPSMGIKGTKVTAAFLNAVNKHFCTGLDTDGDCSLAYSTATGTNDLVTTISPTTYFPAAYVNGMPLYIKTAATNTGAMTLDVNGIGAVAIKKNGTEALVAGDVQAGQIISVGYDGTNMQLLSPVSRVTAISDGTNAIHVKIIEIGDWNMVSTATVTIAHGLDSTKIRPPVSVIIRQDTGYNTFPLTPGVNVSAPNDAYISYFEATAFVLTRKTGGYFDSVNFDATSYNRGWMTIFYVD